MLTSQGFKALVTMFILTASAATISVYHALTLSMFIVASFLLSYVVYASNELKSIQARDFDFSRKISKALPKMGEKFEVTVSVTNRSARGVNVVISDSTTGLKLVSGETAVEKFLEPNGMVSMRYTVLADKRGVHRLGPLMVRVSDEHGFVCRQIELEKEFKVVVAAAGMERPKLVDAVKKVAPHLSIGTGSSFEHGTDDVFRELTKYEEGQPIKAIDWRRTARMDGEIYVRKFDKLSRLKICFLIDCSRSNSMGDPSLLDSCISAVTSMSSRMLERGDSVTVVAVGASKPGAFHTSGMGDYEGLVRFLSAVSPGLGSDFTEQIEMLRKYDAVFLIGRFPFANAVSIRKAFEQTRRSGGVFYVLVPLLEYGERFPEALNLLEEHRVQSLRQYCSYVFAVKQSKLVQLLRYLHETLKMAA